MMEPRFIFRLTSYHTDKLLPQVSRALELRNEIVSRAKYPFLWKRKDKLKAKGVQSVRARVVNLARYCPGLTIPQLRQSLANAFGQVYGLPVQPLPDGFVDGAAVDALTQMFSDPAWLYGRDAPAGQTVYSARFGWGGVTLCCTLAEGRLRQVSLASDGLEADYLAGVPARLEGCAAAPAAVAIMAPAKVYLVLVTFTEPK